MTDISHEPHRFPEVGVIEGETAVPVEPVAQSGSSRPRWLVPGAAAVAALLVVTLVGAWALSATLSGSANDATKTGYAYLPSSTTVTAEIRLDLPAGQKEQFGSFLSRFPGFGDPGQVESRLVQALDDAVRSLSQGKANYSDDVKPFFSGWVVGGVSIRATPMLGPGAPLIVFGVYDRDAAETAMVKLRSSSLTWTDEDVDGVRIWSGRFASNDPGFDFGGQAYAVTDDALLYASDADAIKAALDTRAGNKKSLLENERFASSIGRVPAGRLGVLWVDINGMGGAMVTAPLAAGGPACAALLASYPTDGIAALYLRDGRAVVDLSYGRREGAPALPIRHSVLDSHVPADAFFYAETKQSALGVNAESIECLRNTPGIKAELEKIELQVGKLDELLGWIGDTGVAVRFDGTKLTGGVLVDVTDENRASEALGQLRLALTAMNTGGTTVTVNEETYANVRLVTFDFSGGPTGNLPPIAPSPSLAYALKDGLLVIGVDASFAKAVLDTNPTNSLATQVSYRRALDFAGAIQNSGEVYVDMPRALQVYDTVAGSTPEGSEFGELREYLDVVDDASLVVLGDDRSVTVRMTLNTRAAP